MCRALVIMPGLICWSNNFHIIMMALKVTAGKLLRMVIIDLLLRRMKNVSSTEETLLMTYLTMGLINHALQVIFKSLNLSDSSMRALVRREVKKYPWVEMIQTNLTNSCTTTMVSYMSACFPGHEELVLGKCSLDDKIDFSEPRDSVGIKKKAEMSRDCQPFLFFNLKLKIKKLKTNKHFNFFSLFTSFLFKIATLVLYSSMFVDFPPSISSDF